MPHGKKSLADISARQRQRRIREDPLGILFGSSLPKKPAPAVSKPAVATAGVDSEQESYVVQDGFSVVLDNEASNNSHSDESVGDGQHTGHMYPCSGGAFEARSLCLSCLVCICFEDCEICKHTFEACYHCEYCVKGEEIDSDAEPLSSDDEYDDLPDNSHVQSVEPSDKDYNVRDQLALWSLNNNISHRALKELMVMLNSCFNANLPKDPRTLLKTPASVPIRPCAPGLYWHAGLKKGLHTLDWSNAPNAIELSANVDGIPLCHSSRSTFWPILCSVKNFKGVILVGAYHGCEKPNDSNDFFSECNEELVDLCTNGFTVNEKTIPVCAKRFILDAQAKSFLFKTKSCSGYCSCTKCSEEGRYVQGRVVFPSLNAPLRTDSDFRSKRDEEYHLGESIIETIPGFDLIKGVPLDYMHLVLLGVVRKLLNLLTSGKVGVRLQSTLVNTMSDLLETMKSFIPKDFVRKTRSLIYLKLMKAAEFRLLLFYVLPVVLTVLIAEYENRYQNFLILHVALTILSSEQLLQHYGTTYPNELLKSYVEGFKNIYGIEQLSHNVHNLVHLSEDVANHGVLDDFSAFEFENYLQELKNTVRKGDKPLQQLAKRHLEAAAVRTKKSQNDNGKEIEFFGRAICRYLPPECGDPQYRSVTFRNFSLDLSIANRYCGLRDGKIVEIHNIAYHKRLKYMVIIGQYFKSKVDFYEYPLPSSHLGIFLVSNLSQFQYWRVNDVLLKYLRLPFKHAHVVFPIMHTVPVPAVEINAA